MVLDGNINIIQNIKFIKNISFQNIKLLHQYTKPIVKIYDDQNKIEK